MDVLALLSYGWFERACVHCGKPTKERVRHMTMEIVGFHENHVWYGEKRPLHFACNVAKTAPDGTALMPAQIHDGTVLVRSLFRGLWHGHWHRRWLSVRKGA